MLAIAYVRLTMLYATTGDVDAALESVGRAPTVDPLLPLTSAAEVAVRLWRGEFESPYTGRPGDSTPPVSPVGPGVLWHRAPLFRTAGGKRWSSIAWAL